MRLSKTRLRRFRLNGEGMLNTKLVLAVLAALVIVLVVFIKVVPGDAPTISKTEENVPPGKTSLPGTKGFYRADVQNSKAKEF